MRKGQMEIIIILGITVVAVVIALYAMSDSGLFRNPVPPGVHEEQRVVADEVKNLVREAADETLRTMMAHGGYHPDVSGLPSETTEFLLTEVPVWQKCSSTNIPSLSDIEAWMEESIGDIVWEGLDQAEAKFNNRVDFEDNRNRITVDADIKGAGRLDPKYIEITLNMDTTVTGGGEEYPMSTDFYPYRVRVPTSFGRIYQFAKDFAESSARDAPEGRFFDMFTIEAIYFSKELENTHVKLPTTGVMTECGEVVYRSPDQINDYLLEVAEYVMSSVLWWKNSPDLCPGGTCLDRTKTFPVDSLGGGTYPDLDVRTLLTDDWIFKLSDVFMATNFEMPSHGYYTVPVCTATYNHAYQFTYPFVIRVKDPQTGYSFNFASMVGV